MKPRLLAACVLACLLAPAVAGANPEPTAYDTRSIGMGITGVSYLEQPAALVLNPAHLEGIDKLGFTVNFTALFTRQRAPVRGPNTQFDSDLGFGPLPSGFLSGRIAPRVVFGAGIYIETGYGSAFSDVVCMDGDPVGGPPDYEPSTEPGNCTNPDPQDLKVSFFVGEFAVGFSFLAHEKFWFGVALRLPFSKQLADLWQNSAAALPGYTPGMPGYGRVRNDVGGVGFPSPRFGFSIRPHRKVRIGVMYRMYSKIRLTGTTELALAPGSETVSLDAEADWFIPHALEFGLSYQANSHLLLVWESRVQFHNAQKAGNLNQTVVASLPDGTPLSTIVVPFGWTNAWMVKLGFEYRFKKEILALRLGVDISAPATSEVFAQYFTPPPSNFTLSTLTAGLGFYWNDRNNPSIKDKYRFDIAGVFSFTGKEIGNPYIGTDQQIPGTDTTATVCTDQQVVRTGCPGTYRVFTYWASASFTLQY
jgi:hypothetical protein